MTRSGLFGVCTGLKTPRMSCTLQVSFCETANAEEAFLRKMTCRNTASFGSPCKICFKTYLIYIHTPTHTQSHTQTHNHTCLCIRLHKYTCENIHKYAYVCVYIYVCVCIDIYVFTQINIHVYTQVLLYVDLCGVDQALLERVTKSCVYYCLAPACCVT